MDPTRHVRHEALPYALHAEGLAAVMLNWSERKERDRECARRRLAEKRLVITMMAVAASRRG